VYRQHRQHRGVCCKINKNSARAVLSYHRQCWRWLSRCTRCRFFDENTAVFQSRCTALVTTGFGVKKTRSRHCDSACIPQCSSVVLQCCSVYLCSSLIVCQDLELRLFVQATCQRKCHIECKPLVLLLPLNR
jgi:hypothetical protein